MLAKYTEFLSDVVFVSLELACSYALFLLKRYRSLISNVIVLW